MNSDGKLGHECGKRQNPALDGDILEACIRKKFFKVNSVVNY